MSNIAQSNTQSQRKPSTGGAPNPAELATQDHARGTKREHEEDDDDDGEDEEGTGRGNEKRAGRRKIKIEYIDDKSRRHITFSKRKAGIMKKAYELSTLTGTQVLLLVVSETGLVYTFTTPKLQPLVTKPEGKNLIQACLNAPDNQGPDTSSTPRQTQSVGYSSDSTPPVDNSTEPMYDTPDRKHTPTSGAQVSPNYLNMGQYPPSYSGMPSGIPMGASNIQPTYMSTTGQYQQHPQQQYIGGQYPPSQYMQTAANSGFWNQTNGSGSGSSNVKQFPNQTPEKQK